MIGERERRRGGRAALSLCESATRHTRRDVGPLSLCPYLCTAMLLLVLLVSVGFCWLRVALWCMWWCCRVPHGLPHGPASARAAAGRSGVVCKFGETRRRAGMVDGKRCGAAHFLPNGWAKGLPVHRRVVTSARNSCTRSRPLADRLRCDARGGFLSRTKLETSVLITNTGRYDLRLNYHANYGFERRGSSVSDRSGSAWRCHGLCPGRGGPVSPFALQHPSGPPPGFFQCRY